MESVADVESLEVRKAGLSICSSFGVKNVGGNSTASITSAGEGASAMATTTRSVVNAPQSKSTSSVAAKGSAVAVARPGLLEMGLVGLAGFLAL